LPSGDAPSLNPVYSYVESLDDLDSLVSEKPEIQKPLRKAKNGPLIPDTSGQKWHYLENVNYGRSGGADARALRGNPLPVGVGRGAALGSAFLSFEETFGKDHVFVSMRFPYSYGYNEAFLTKLVPKLAGDYPWCQVQELGKSKEKRALRIVQIGQEFHEDGQTPKPTVLIYAREHGNEHDTSHVAEGAIRFLLSKDEQAAKIRERVCFLIIPLVDPDGATDGKYDNVTNSYFFGDKIPEALAYSAWFKNWMDAGKGLHLVLNFHNVRSFGAPHLFSPEMEPQRLVECKTFHQFVVNELKEFDVQKNPAQISQQLFRLGGWLKNYYGALCIPYEINSQAASRHLTIRELQQIGAEFTVACAKYLESEQAKPLLKSIAKTQKERQERWAKYGNLFEHLTPLLAEQKCRQMPQADAACDNRTKK
jgi:hypothetical protein